MSAASSRRDDEELWSPIEDTGYMVSTHGRVRNPRGWELRPFVVSKTGHLGVDLPIGRRRIHRMVLEAFVGPAPDGTECCHGDGDPTNNRLKNLRWDTRSANVLDLRKDRTHCPHGHEYTEDNSYFSPSGWRSCCTCRDIGREKWRASAATIKGS